MSIFQQWLRKRSLLESDMADKFRFSSDNNKFSSDDIDYADDQDKIREELFKTVMNKYPDETIEFLNGIAQRGDEEISVLLNKIQKDINHGSPPSHPKERDEVKPPTADTGHNPTE